MLYFSVRIIGRIYLEWVEKEKEGGGEREEDCIWKWPLGAL